ncbi:MAG: branched-chain amino acid ABC transporter permease [Ruminococcaceae bacterium]|nr:branched-chain amino acid ABC transporter permease [Oscillospiraceae bacterium]
MELFLSTLINGLSLGGIYAMIALGYTMVYGIAKMLNFAHGDIIMVGGYTIYVFMATKNPLIAILMAVIVCIILGIVIEKVAYKPLRGASPLAVLITAIGVSYLLQSLAQIIFGSANKMVTVYEFGSITIFGVPMQVSALVTLGVTIAVMVILTLFIKYTRLGRAMIAVSEDKGAAQLMGINVNGIITVTFAIGSALAALAGLFYLLKAPSISNTLGAMPGIKAFTAAVIGGIGSIPGAMLGGILLGMVECISYKITAIAPYTDAIEFSILIIILLVRPTGFLGKKRREKV